MKITTFNPTTEKPLHSYEVLSQSQCFEKIESAHQSFLQWRNRTLDNRLDFFTRLIGVLGVEKEACAKLVAQEMGKPIVFARAEIEKCIWCCQYYLDHAKVFLAPEKVNTEFSESFVTYNPLGVILAVMPWNFPFWQVLRFAIPTIMAGNTVLLKHASIVTGSAKKIEEMFIQAGFPIGVLNQLTITSDMVDDIIAHPNVCGVTITGSEAAGRSVASAAGRYLKRVALELGGNDACVVMKDANLEAAAHAIVSSRLRNSGQVCVSTKRVIVQRDIHDQLLVHIRKLLPSYIPGDPLDEATQMGPMARGDLRDELHHQIQKAIAQGAQLLEGGFIPEGRGFYYPPTLLTNVTKQSIIYEEELFGPVISMSTFETADEAFELANCTRFGLGGSIFSSQIQAAMLAASDRLEAGVCFVNLPVTSDPRLPFGGIKASGFGRELSKLGMIEFMNIKTVIVHA